MGVLASIPRSLKVLGGNPSIFVGASVVTAVTVAPNAIRFVSPSLALLGLVLSLAMNVFGIPFLVGGLLGMADEANTGGTSLGQFVESGIGNYVSLTVAWILFYVVELVLGLVLSLAFVFLGTFTLVAGADAGGVDTGNLILVALMGVGFFLVVVAPAFLFQYYPGAVVVEDCGVVGGLNRAISVLKANPLRTFAFDVLVAVVAFLAILALWGVFLVAGSGLFALGATGTVTLSGSVEIGLVIAAIYFGGSTLVGTVVGAFQYTYYAVFYRDIAGDEGPSDPGRTRTDDAGESTGGDDADESPFAVRDW